MRERITGTEMEYAVLTKGHFSSDYDQASQNFARDMVKHLPEGLFASNGDMLSNGARYYVDIGDHPEYATPENDSFIGTVAGEIAGERLVYASMKSAAKERQIAKSQLKKRVVDQQLNTWGYHVSFCTNAEYLPIQTAVLMPLGVHLATHNVFSGAGAVANDYSGNPSFVIAQKVLNLNEDFHHQSYSGHEPLISLRNESLADDDRFSRVHITSMDANMSPWATWMKLGTTSIVLRLIETGYLSRSPFDFRHDMHRVAKDVAHDDTLKRTIEFGSGGGMSALEIQEYLLHVADLYESRHGLPDEEKAILNEWQRVIEDLRNDPVKTKDRVEWVLKKLNLERFMEETGLGYGSPEVIERELEWSTLGPNSIGQRLRDTLWQPWMPSEAAISHAELYGPKTTRAFNRGRLIAFYALRGNHVSASWARVVSHDEKVVHVFDDPYQTEPQEAGLELVHVPDDEFC